MACWEERGLCDQEMRSRCPHALQTEYHPCPADCSFSWCDNPQHDPVSGLDILSYPEVDRSAAMKENCRYCRFFLEHGPRLAG